MAAYRNRAPKMIERLLDDNPHLAKCHRYSPFLPVGTQVRIPIDYEVLSGAPQRKSTVVLWGTTPEGNMTQGTNDDGTLLKIRGEAMRCLTSGSAPACRHRDRRRRPG